MSVKIRLTRGGRKKLPFYHVVVADARAPRDGKFIEKLGFYNPLIKKGEEGRLVWDTTRVNHWLDQGAQPTSAISKFILEGKLGNDKQRAKLEKVLNARKEVIGAKIAAAQAIKDAEAKAKSDAEAKEAAEAAAEEKATAAAAAKAEAETAKEEAPAAEAASE